MPFDLILGSASTAKEGLIASQCNKKDLNQVLVLQRWSFCFLSGESIFLTGDGNGMSGLEPRTCFVLFCFGFP